MSDKCKSACQEKKIRLAHKMYTGKRHRSVQLDDDDDDDYDDGNGLSRKKTKERSREKTDASCNCYALHSECSRAISRSTSAQIEGEIMDFHCAGAYTAQAQAPIPT